MMTIWNTGLAAAAVALAALHGTPAKAADLYGGYAGGSVKDGPVHYAAPSSRCYLRGDVGYALAGKPDVRWPVTDATTGDLIGDDVTNVQIDNTWLIEGGIGCGLGGNWRGEITLGWRGEQNVDGEPILWRPVPGLEDPLHTSISTWTLMLNAYRDLGHWGNFTPYVGAGIGVAHHSTDEVYFTGNPSLTNRIEGKDNYAFAWSLMAGTGYRLSDRLTLDLGYRYIDLGKAESGRVDNAGFVNPRVTIDDITAHEFKVGLRIGFGGREPHYGPLK